MRSMHISTPFFQIVKFKRRCSVSIEQFNRALTFSDRIRSVVSGLERPSLSTVPSKKPTGACSRTDNADIRPVYGEGPERALFVGCCGMHEWLHHCESCTQSMQVVVTNDRSGLPRNPMRLFALRVPTTHTRFRCLLSREHLPRTVGIQSLRVRMSIQSARVVPKVRQTALGYVCPAKQEFGTWNDQILDRGRQLLFGLQPGSS